MINGKVLQDPAAEEAIKEVSGAASTTATALTALTAKVPDAELPTTAGNYQLTVAMDGETITYSWTAIE